MLIKQPPSPTVEYTLKKYFHVDSTNMDRLAGLIITNNNVLLFVYPSGKNQIVVGDKKTVTQARNIIDLNDGTTLTYYADLGKKLPDVETAKLGAYIQVDNENKIINVTPGKHMFLCEINWLPGWEPANKSEMETAVYSYADIEDMIILIQDIDDYARSK